MAHLLRLILLALAVFGGARDALAAVPVVTKQWSWPGNSTWYDSATQACTAWIATGNDGSIFYDTQATDCRYKNGNGPVGVWGSMTTRDSNACPANSTMQGGQCICASGFVEGQRCAVRAMHSNATGRVPYCGAGK